MISINDLPQTVKDCDVRVYADDTCISYAHKTVKTIEGKLNSDFNTLCDNNSLTISFLFILLRTKLSLLFLLLPTQVVQVY